MHASARCAFAERRKIAGDGIIKKAVVARNERGSEAAKNVQRKMQHPEGMGMDTGIATDEVIDTIAEIEVQRQAMEQEAGRGAASRACYGLAMSEMMR